jgi:hypothetical protein
MANSSAVDTTTKDRWAPRSTARQNNVYDSESDFAKGRNRREIILRNRTRAAVSGGLIG